MFDWKFLRRLGEQALITFLAGFTASLATFDRLDKAALAAAAMAGMRALYGFATRPMGTAKDSPSIF